MNDCTKTLTSEVWPVEPTLEIDSILCTTYCTNQEKEAVIKFSGNRWSDLDLSKSTTYGTIIPIITIESFIYLLPAYMLAVIKCIERNDNTGLDPDNVIYSITPNDDFTKERVSLMKNILNRNQIYSICQFVQYLIKIQYGKESDIEECLQIAMSEWCHSEIDTN